MLHKVRSFSSSLFSPSSNSLFSSARSDTTGQQVANSCRDIQGGEDDEAVQLCSLHAAL